jgi:hypothetical protein
MTSIEKERKQTNFSALLGQIRQQTELNKTIFFTDQDDWDVYGDSLKHYEETFAPILKPETILGFIKQRPFPTIVDIMAPSATIAGFFKKIPEKSDKLGIAVSLLDRRSPYAKNRDRELNIKQLSGNIMSGSCWKKIDNELGGKKADLIMERAEGGLWCLPKNENFYLSLLNNAWNLLCENNGMLLFQVPSYIVLKRASVHVEGWLNILKKQGLNFSYSNNKHSDNDQEAWLDRGVLKIIKTPDSPKKLPLLR